MKKILLFLTPIAAVLSVHSCKKIDGDILFDYGDIIPPEYLTEFSLLQCNRYDMYHERESNYLRNEFAFSLSSYTPQRDQIMSFINTVGQASQYFADRYSKVEESFSANGISFTSSNPAPVYYDAGIRDEVRVYSDKVLFGCAPGQDFSNHVFVCQTGQRCTYACSFPEFDYSGKIIDNMNIRDYFKVGTAILADIVSFAFDVIPEDLPNDFRLTIEIPVVNNTPWGDLNLPFIQKGPNYRRSEQTCVYKTSIDIHLTE